MAALAFPLVQIFDGECVGTPVFWRQHLELWHLTLSLRVAQVQLARCLAISFLSLFPLHLSQDLIIQKAKLKTELLQNAYESEVNGSFVSYLAKDQYMVGGKELISW